MFKSYTPTATLRTGKLLVGKRRSHKRKLALLVRSSPEQRQELSNPQGSTGTLVNHPSVSAKLNSTSLRLAVRGVSTREPRQLLKRIFRTPDKLPTETSPPLHRKSIELRPRQRRGCFDSTFNQEEAGKIMSELQQIRSPRVWQEVLTGFQTRPGLLLDLIPLRTPRTPHASGRSKQTFRFPSTETCTTPKSVVHTEAITPEHFETLHSEADTLTEDWKRSLLNFNLRRTPQFICPEGLNESELLEANARLPRRRSDLAGLQQKAMNSLELLLVELLGTKKDVDRFRQRFADISPSTVKALISKCLDMFAVRTLTSKLLLLVNQRERLLKQLKYCEAVELKKRVLEIYDLNKIVRAQIERWVCAEVVPFECFMYAGKPYLDKMTEDNLLLQAKLAQLQASQ